MFTVLSNTRNSNLYLISALAIVMVVLVTFAVVPALSAPEPALIPVTGISEAGSDYYQRHPELRVPGAVVIDMTGDFFLRHPELSAPAGIAVDTGDYFLRHPELRPATESQDLSDYFLRH